MATDSNIGGAQNSVLGNPTLYHRLESPSQTKATAQRQQASGEIWGRPRKIGGTYPCVKAYWGPLPSGQRGIEFTTPISPTHPNPSMALWLHNFDPAVRLVKNSSGEDFAVISVTVTKNTQVP